jgi:hypothetical protein
VIGPDHPAKRSLCPVSFTDLDISVRLAAVAKKLLGLGCLILFALPFVGGGLFVAFLAFKGLSGWVEVADWVETPARITYADLEVHDGDDSTTYKVVARYEYEWEGERFGGNRVSVHSGADNIGSFHQDAHLELARHVGSGEPFICFVNPDDPSEAILYRKMRWGLFALMGLFATIFTGAGVGIVAKGFLSSHKVAEQDALENSHPQEPWRWNSDWQEGQIRASGKAQFILPAVMAVFWNLVSTPLLFVIPEEFFDKGNKLALIGLVFPVVGIGLAIWAIRAFVRWKKFGDSVFEMTTYPGVIGGKLAGRIVTSVDLNPTEGFHLTISCVNRVTTGSGKNRRTSERVLWQQKRHLLREPLDWDPTKSEIPVLFAIPFDVDPTEKRSDSDEVVWRLQLAAEVPGVDYAVQFDVPIFRTADSKQDFELEERPYAELEAPWDPAKALADDRIFEEISPKGNRLYVFPAARHKGAAVALTSFFLVWAGFTWLIGHLGAGILFTGVFGFFAALIFLGVVTLWFERRTIEIGTQALVLRGEMLGVGRTRTIPRTLITSIRPVRGMQSGNKLYYQVKIETQGGKSHVAANRIGSLSLARQISESLG